MVKHSVPGFCMGSGWFGIEKRKFLFDFFLFDNAPKLWYAIFGIQT